MLVTGRQLPHTVRQYLPLLHQQPVGKSVTLEVPEQDGGVGLLPETSPVDDR